MVYSTSNLLLIYLIIWEKSGNSRKFFVVFVDRTSLWINDMISIESMATQLLTLPWNLHLPAAPQ